MAAAAVHLLCISA